MSCVPKRAFADGDVSKIRTLLEAHVTQRPLAGAFRLKRTLVLWTLLIVTFLAIWYTLRA
jgi:hypothetical protein